MILKKYLLFIRDKLFSCVRAFLKIMKYFSAKYSEKIYILKLIPGSHIYNTFLSHIVVNECAHLIFIFERIRINFRKRIYLRSL